LVAGFLFLSGTSALLYQTAWQRSLGLVFGASTAASAAVLAVFLGGLGLGGLLLGRRAERAPRPLLLYGNLELGVAGAAALSPFVIDLLGAGYLRLGGVATLGQPLATLLRLSVAVAAIGPAAFLMGGTLPAAARAVEGDDDRGRSRLALLYGVNTLGAVAGSLLGTFVLFEAFGTRATLWTGALLNTLAAVTARSVGRSAAELPVTQATNEAAPPLDGRSLLAYGVAAGVGAAFLLLEIVWYRLLSPILGGSTYTFGLILAVALAGIGLGGWLYALRRDDRPATLSALATVTALEAVLVAVPLALGDDIAIYAALTRPLANLGFPALVVSWWCVAMVVVFPAAFVSGYQFPMLFALLGSGRARVARHVGTLYAFNTAGSILGSLLGGFVLLPRMGAVGVYRLVAEALVAIAACTIALDLRTTRRGGVARATPVVALGALAVVLARATGPTAVFRHEPIGAGLVQLAAHSRNELTAWMRAENDRIVWQADGVESSVALKRTDQLAFVVNGKIDGGVFSDRATQAGLALLGALVHGGPKRALVIGLGTGMTAGWLGALPGMEHVDVAELEPSIVEVARRARAANQGVLDRKNVTLRFGDGRELVLTSREQYDLVVSEPSNPYRAGISSLYTIEFYEAVSRRLRDHGLLVQWVQGYAVSADTIRTIARTLRTVFPHVEIWQSMFGDILFTASKEPRVLDADALRARLSEEPYRTGTLRTMLFGDVEGLLGRFIATNAAVTRMIAGDARVNTDDHNDLDYAFARTVGMTDAGLPARLLGASLAAHTDRPEVRGSVDWDRVAELRARAWLTDDTEVPAFLPMPSQAVSDRVRAVAAGCAGDYGRSTALWLQDGPAEPKDDVERFTIAVGLADRGEPAALGLATGLAAHGFAVESALIRARAARHAKDPVAMLDAAIQGTEALRHDALSLCHAADGILGAVMTAAPTSPSARSRALDALREPFAASTMDEARVHAIERLSIESGDPATCVRGLGARVQNPVWDEGFLEKRLQCLAAAHHPLAERAAQDLLDVRGGTSGTFDLGKP
jgi:spermidine synthase